MAADDGDAADAADAADASARMLADARDADVDKQADRLRAWKASGALLLDLRDASEFHARRIERAQGWQEKKDNRTAGGPNDVQVLRRLVRATEQRTPFLRAAHPR